MLFPILGTLILAPSPIHSLLPILQFSALMHPPPQPRSHGPWPLHQPLGSPYSHHHNSGFLQHGHRTASRSGHELQEDCLSLAVTPASLSTGWNPVGALRVIIWVNKTLPSTGVFDSGPKFSGVEVNEGEGVGPLPLL